MPAFCFTQHLIASRIYGKLINPMVQCEQIFFPSYYRPAFIFSVNPPVIR